MEALNLTRDEVNRMSEALKDETFRQLLSEYAAEISNPDNKRQYEEDITQLEADRGMRVQFIHPQAHHVLKSSSPGGKCFINVCCDPLIEKPSCEAARDRDGNAGHHWTLPHSLTPGRPDRDAKGSACVIYDAVFHPDALHMAEKNARFMKLIDSTAIGGIEDSFQIKLDRSTIKLLKSKYKGVPHPAVIRKPTSEFMKHQQSKCEEKLPFPYPDVCSAAAPRPHQPASSSSKQPRKPHYTLKYRSVVDLQNYRHSRYSTSSTRPKDIMVIIDLPLLTSARDVDVHVTERRLVLETQRGSYKLELSLSYPVDEDKGEAKFNKTTKQLTLILPVLPVKNTESPQMTCDDDDEDEEERDSEDKAELMQKEKPHKTELKGDILTQSTSDGFGQKTVAVESLCLSNSCDVDEIKPHTYDTSISIIMNPTESTTQTDHFPHTCVAEIIPDDEENLSDMKIDSREMTSVCNIGTHMTPDEEFVKKQSMKTAFGATAHESVMSRDLDKIYQNSTMSKQPNVFPSHEEEPQRSSGLNKPLSQKPETREEPNSALNPGNDTIVILNKEIQVQAKEPADVENNSKSHLAIVKETEPDRREIILCDHQTSAAPCFQNSLCFDLD